MLGYLNYSLVPTWDGFRGCPDPPRTRPVPIRASTSVGPAIRTHVPFLTYFIDCEEVPTWNVKSNDVPQTMEEGNSSCAWWKCGITLLSAVVCSFPTRMWDTNESQYEYFRQSILVVGWICIKLAMVIFVVRKPPWGSETRWFHQLLYPQSGYSIAISIFRWSDALCHFCIHFASICKEHWYSTCNSCILSIVP